MPKKNSGGPPYYDPPAKFAVVIKPWSTRSPPNRLQQDYDKVATWISYILWDAVGKKGRIPTVECIYRMRTRDEVIVQLPLETNISPLLGSHRWASFVQGWKGDNVTDNGACTLVFEYNWTNNGNPATHNWEEFFPNTMDFKYVPLKSPYPPPSWTSTPSTFRSLVNPCPPKPCPPPVQHVLQIPLTTAEKEREQTSSQETLPKSQQVETAHEIFQPYHPPLQHPSNARFPAKVPVSDTKPPKFLQKLDPYQIEEEANKLLSIKGDSKNGILQGKSKVDVLKLEEPSASEYQPSAELLAAFNILNNNMQLGMKRAMAEDNEDNSKKKIKLEEL